MTKCSFDFRRGAIAAAAFLIGSLCSCRHLERPESDAGFARVRPVFEEGCLHCHDGRISPMPDMRAREQFMATGGAGLVVPGDPEASRLLQLLELGDEDPGAMPPTGHGLDARSLQIVREWISAGAPWPAGREGRLQARGPGIRSI